MVAGCAQCAQVETVTFTVEQLADRDGASRKGPARCSLTSRLKNGKAVAGKLVDQRQISIARGRRGRSALDFPCRDRAARCPVRLPHVHVSCSSLERRRRKPRRSRRLPGFFIPAASRSRRFSSRRLCRADRRFFAFGLLVVGGDEARCAMMQQSLRRFSALSLTLAIVLRGFARFTDRSRQKSATEAFRIYSGCQSRDRCGPLVYRAAQRFFCCGLRRSSVKCCTGIAVVALRIEDA